MTERKTSVELTEEPYQVRLETFTGPLDLLLHLIKKNQINIYDIPIALITRQYLNYLDFMKTLNLAVAGEFLVMAATLIQIKARMLLPRPEQQEEQEEVGDDPREELVRRLLAYQQYKEAAGQLGVQEHAWRDLFARGAQPAEAQSEETLLEDLTVYDLIDALQGVLARTVTRPSLELVPDTVTVQDRMAAILDSLNQQETLAFYALLKEEASRPVVIGTFLALLELARRRLVRIYQGELFGPIYVGRCFIPGNLPDTLE